ncbi:MAG: L-seryl-tRNA(Sec) selenium transferase [Candidatus Eremiobacteraeota bacterium]|nr:L-seryl-tRNA(Sec) selenium transferase [Candidatus Eremiobacteraeota bacterium]
MDQERLRALPAVHRLLAESGIAAYCAELGTAVVKQIIDGVLRDVRSDASLSASPVPRFDDIVAMVHLACAHEASQGLVEVLNGTGVLLHTNLGRAPLAQEALEAIRRIGSGYSNLEYDLETGARGSRYERVSSLLRATSGAEDGLVVNNCAAAMFLILDAFAKRREVIVSRSELIEIGGGFRLPDVLTHSGARLVEVGTTNKVYLDDFERALSADTALLLRTHMSNYRIVGFVTNVAPAELAALGRRVGVPVIEDLGSGALIDLAQFGLPHERTVHEAVLDGLDLVAFSGDKLLGGPQAGIIVGRASLISRLRANPLLRALRVDKATLAALAATLQCYSEGRWSAIPLYRMLAAPQHELLERAQGLAENLQRAEIEAQARTMEGCAGGGTLPLAPLPSAGIVIPHAPNRGSNVLASALRKASPPIVVRSEEAGIAIDLRAIPAARDRSLQDAVIGCVRAGTALSCGN